jgi:predicted GIY-YIG superfamily endonuclease
MKKTRSTRRTIRDLYPRLDDHQLHEAEERLRRYIEHSLRIFDRLRADPDAYARFKALTQAPKTPKINHEEPSRS